MLEVIGLLALKFIGEIGAVPARDQLEAELAENRLQLLGVFGNL